MAQTKSTMNLGILFALPLEMRCRHAIETLHAVKTTDVNLKIKCTKNDTWVGSWKLTRMSLPLFRTSSKDTKKFYLWFRFPSQAADMLDMENKTGNGHSFRFDFEGKRKC